MTGPNWTTSDAGEAEIELDPPLELIEAEDVTLDLMHKGCLLLGVDPDDVLAGRDVELPEHPPLAMAEGFFRLVVENHEAYELASMQYNRARALLGVVADHFISASGER
jgi:hypothetical protein